MNADLGGPLHSLIICGNLHDLELEVVEEFLLDGSTFERDSGDNKLDDK